MATRGKAPEIVPPASRAIPLTSLEAHGEVDRRTGIYAAWIKTGDALEAVGAPRREPVLAYVGKAITAGGLQRRLVEHVETGMTGLDELLAVRGRTLYPWWSWMPKPKGEPYRPEPPPLGLLAQEQLLNWQFENLHWSWIECPRDEAPRREEAAIRAGRPLLNRTPAAGTEPPQLRYMSRDARAVAARARWLWQISWFSLLVGRDREQSTGNLWRKAARTREFAVDHLGYPLPETLLDRQVATHAVQQPSDDELWDLIYLAAAAAPARVRHALGSGAYSPWSELRTWWAAHAGAPALREPVSTQKAIAWSLAMKDETTAAGPGQLPQPDHLQMLIRLPRLFGLRSRRH